MTPSSKLFTYASFRLTHLVMDYLHAVFSYYDFHNSNQSTIVKLRRILNSVKNSKLNSEDVWSQKIEDLRQRLGSSNKVLTIVDYGAGKPTEHYSNEQMPAGRQVEVKLSYICQVASTRKKWGLLLHELVKEFKPSKSLELGTAVGISASYQASAMELNQKGHLFTLEGAETLANIAEMNFRQLGLTNLVTVVKGPFENTLDSVLKRMKNLDFSFIDGHHDKQATLKYFAQILPYLQDDAVVVFDDISWSRGMREAWDEIRRSPKVFVSFSVISLPLNNWGIIIIGKTNTLKRQHFFVTI